MIDKINTLLAQSIGTLNALLAVVLVLLGLQAGFMVAGPAGIIVGPLVGVALAVGVCGLLAVLINIRDLLAESVRRQSDL